LFHWVTRTGNPLTNPNTIGVVRVRGFLSEQYRNVDCTADVM
jgi:hypothetical protein